MSGDFEEDLTRRVWTDDAFAARVEDELLGVQRALESREGRIEYGLSRFDAALQGMRAPRFAQGLALVE